MNNESTYEEQPNGPEILVCPGCLHEQIEGSHFCEKCGAPLTAFSTIGPFERIFAQGHAFRRAASGPTSLIVVIGMWILILPQFLMLVMIPFLGAVVYMLTVGAFYTALLFRVTRNYMAHRRQNNISNHGLESTGAPPAAKAPETHP